MTGCYQLYIGVTDMRMGHNSMFVIRTNQPVRLSMRQTQLELHQAHA
jgi:hypothetical protein